MNWNKSFLIEFFRSHPLRQVSLEDEEHQIKLCGVIQPVFEMDLCSHILAQSELSIPQENLDISLTFHDDFLGIHLLVQESASDNPSVSLPIEIPYSALQVQLLT